MEHKGIEYTVVQTINPSGWKWSFERNGRSPKSGIAFDRAEAISAAQRAIGQLIRDQAAAMKARQFANGSCQEPK
ncbi:hypothetical protein JQ621_23500 [Bradyrhizobium manausense]|uniref:hypothetical protein n=1 Tax=Bradyrhizobium manausense TaxID=989370 RepID=UPI001BA6EA95|nr:hypothetical protein [Bradyrhizobium manausense]MBR1090443.1 hypothetical protein [Bradyrhizobium manausense]